MPLNTEIKRLRLLHGLSQTAAAYSAGVSVATLCRWEKGNYYPDARQLTALAKLFGVTEMDLLHPKGEENDMR